MNQTKVGGPIPFCLLTLEEALALPAPTMLVDGILTEGGIGVLYGLPGTGKSFVGLHLAMCVAVGIPWHGYQTIKSPVVYVAAEGLTGLGVRASAWCKHFGYSPGDQIHFIGREVDLSDSESCAALVAAIDDRCREGIALVVIDTYARCSGDTDENSSRDVGRTIKRIDLMRRDLGTAVLIIHHTDKRGIAERGSNALRGAADTMILLEKQPNGTITLTCEKQKDLAPFEAIYLRLAQAADSCIVEATSPVPQVKLHNETTARALDALRHLTESGAHVRSREWLQASGLKPSTFYLARAFLVGTGQVIQEGKSQGARYFLPTLSINSNGTPRALQME